MAAVARIEAVEAVGLASGVVAELTSSESPKKPSIPYAWLLAPGARTDLDRFWKRAPTLLRPKMSRRS